MKSRKSW